MLMVIFGAGASYDSVPSRSPKEYSPTLENRPPLANELFDDRPKFVNAMSRFSRCQPIIPYLQNRSEGVSVESVLEGLQAEAEDYPEGKQQLAAIRYYLHCMIWQCERDWAKESKGITNYKTLLDRIHRWRKPEEQVALVTFNYDVMLEQALPTVGFEVGDLSDYIANDNYKLIKLHGSVNWGREVDTPINLDGLDDYQIAHELINRVADLDISQRFRWVPSYPMGKLGESAVFPALAIPVESKGSYECPSEHLNCLLEFIPKVTKLLIIGWRGAETNFCNLLASQLQQNLKVLTVSSSVKGANEINGRLEKVGLGGELNVSGGGFTDFLVNRRWEEFFST